MKGFIAWDWPGNIRELENFNGRALIVTRGKLVEALEKSQKEHDRVTAPSRRKPVESLTSGQMPQATKTSVADESWLQS